MRNVVSLLFLSLLFVSNISSAQLAQTQLNIYTGFGLKKPLEEIAEVYKENHNVDFSFNFTQSGRQALAELKTKKDGDLFIVGSDVLYKNTKNEGIVGEGYSIAHHTPAIIVSKTNPKNIQTLEDLSREDVRVMLGEVNADMNTNRAQANTAQKILLKNNLTNIHNSSNAKTTDEMIEQLISGGADAMIETIDSVYNIPEVSIVRIDPVKNIDQVITGGVISSSSNASQAKEFLEFINSKQGKEIFKRNGFEPVN